MLQVSPGGRERSRRPAMRPQADIDRPAGEQRGEVPYERKQ